MDDHDEAVVGWILAGTADTFMTSDPRFTDTDRDGLDDAEEKAIRSNPTDPDTDGDGLRDGVDPFPLAPAIRLFAVSESDATGVDTTATSWDSRSTLAEAVAEANRRNGNSDASDDVSQIWVSAGAHDADAGALECVHGGFQILGGFALGDAVIGARDADPLTNQTVIYSSGGDPPTTSGAPVDFRLTNSAASSDYAGRLDGFTVAGFSGDASAIKVAYGSVELRHLLVTGNHGEGAVSINGPGSVDGESCIFLDNRTDEADGGGAVRDNGNRASIWRDCDFALNAASRNGGAYYRRDPQDREIRTRFERCSFYANEVFATGDAKDPVSDIRKGGAAIYSAGGLVLLDCDFTGNTTRSNIQSFNHDFDTHGLWAARSSCAEAMHRLLRRRTTTPRPTS